MLKKHLILASIYLPIGAIIAYFVVTSDNQGPWLIVMLIFFILYSIFGNYYIYFYSGRNDHIREDIKTNHFNLLGYILYYGGAALFFLLSIQVLFRWLVLGLEIGSEYFHNIAETYVHLSTLRLMSWLVSGILFILTSVALIVRGQHAWIYMTLGTAVFIFGAVHDRFFLHPGTYEPAVGGDFVIGIGLVIWILVAIMFRIRGAFPQRRK